MKNTTPLYITATIIFSILAFAATSTLFAACNGITAGLSLALTLNDILGNKPKNSNSR